MMTLKFDQNNDQSILLTCFILEVGYSGVFQINLITRKFGTYSVKIRHFWTHSLSKCFWILEIRHSCV